MKGRTFEYASGPTPLDADDLGRCLRLVRMFPGWKERLSEVAVEYPATKWPTIVSRWDELECAAPADQTAILQSL